MSASNTNTQIESLMNYMPIFKLDRAQGPLTSKTE